MLNFEVCAYLVKVKEGENFNRRNTLGISRIKIWAWRWDWAKWGVFQRSQINDKELPTGKRPLLQGLLRLLGANYEKITKEMAFVNQIPAL